MMSKLNLNYHYTTCANANPNHAMVLIHGFMGSPSDWDNLLHNYQHRYNCLRIEIPGHHTNTIGSKIISLSHLSFSTLSYEIYQLIVGLKLTQIILIGYSMGGRIGMHFSHHYPQLIRQLIMISTNMGYASPLEKAYRLSSDFAQSRVIQTTKWSNFVEYWYDQPLFAKLKKSPFFDSILNKRRQLTPYLMSEVVRLLSSGNHPYYPPILQQLPFRVDYIFGKQDAKYATQVDINQWPFRCTGIANADHALHITHANDVSLFLNEILIT